MLSFSQLFISFINSINLTHLINNNSAHDPAPAHPKSPTPDKIDVINLTLMSKTFCKKTIDILLLNINCNALNIDSPLYKCVPIDTITTYSRIKYKYTPIIYQLSRYFNEFYLTPYSIIDNHTDIILLNKTSRVIKYVYT